MLVRAGLTAASVAAAAFLGVGLYGSHLETRAETLEIARPERRPPGEVRTALDRLERAARLTPDHRPEVSRAVILIFAQRRTEAAELLERVVRREPANVDAWSALALALADIDPRRAADARRRVLALSPPVP